MQENILFEGLPPNKRTELMKNSIFKKAKKNSYIFREGDKVDSIIYIISGTIKLRNYDSAGNERIVGIFSDNELWKNIRILSYRKLRCKRFSNKPSFLNHEQAWRNRVVRRNDTTVCHLSGI